MISEIKKVPFGNYYLVSKLAHGGMAEVFLGVEKNQQVDAQKLVIKRILPDLREPRFYAMFINEAQLAAQMDHPNIVKVLDFGEEAGQLYMVMEHVNGMDCWRFSRRLYPLGDNPVGIAVFIVCEVLKGLEYAHSMTDVNNKPLSVVHRDLSPSNVYLSIQGDVKLGDFGIALIESNRYRSIELIPKGKYGYMAPEQVAGNAVDCRADVYSVGVVLSELLIGQKLFAGTSQLSVMLNIKDGRLDILEKNAAKIPEPLLDILRRALAKDPDERYGSAAAFRNALCDFVSGEGNVVSRADLAMEVQKAVEIGVEQESAGADVTSVSGQNPVDGGEEALLAVMTPNTLDEVSPFSNEDFKTGETPVTLETGKAASDERYMAQISDGLTIGPTSYAHIIEFIYSDKIDGNTLISTDGRHFVTAKELPELARHLPMATPTCDVGEIKTPDRRGLFEMEAPMQVLLALGANQNSGLLICQQDKRRKEVYVIDGYPVYVGSNDSNELLGEFLVEKGVIDRRELEMALALLPKFNGHLGDTLIALGMLTAIELFSHIRNQIKNRLDELLTWKFGSYDFYEGVACREDVLQMKIDSFELIKNKLLIDIEMLDGIQVLDKMSPCIVSPSSFLPEIIAKLNLPESLNEKIKSVGGWMKVRDVMIASGQTQTVLAQALYVAIETGMWMFEGPKPPWKISSSE